MSTMPAPAQPARLDPESRHRGVRLQTLRERRRLYVLALMIVERHYNRALTLPLLAKALACSPRQLNRVYAQFGQGSFHEDLHARRMTAAAELLTQTTLPVHKVALSVGYRTARYFGQVFRNWHGVAPTVYRTHPKRHPAAADLHCMGDPPPLPLQQERTNHAVV